MPSLFALIKSDLRAKAEWCYEDTGWKAIVKTLLTDGTAAMICYRLMQWARRWRLAPLEMVFNKINAVFSSCVIGRGADFGPEFVLIHSQGVFRCGDCGHTLDKPKIQKSAIHCEKCGKPALSLDQE